MLHFRRRTKSQKNAGPHLDELATMISADCTGTMAHSRA